MVNAKKAIERLYTGLCDVYEFSQVKDPVTKITKQAEAKVISAQPCRVSYESKTSAGESEAAANLKQTITLIIDPDLDIKPGSRIVATQNGRVTEYRSAGVPRVYTGSQQITLELVDKRA